MEKQTEQYKQGIENMVQYAINLLDTYIEVSPTKLGGKPVLRGTRFSAAQVLAQIADGDSIEDLVNDFDLDCDLISSFLHGLAVYLDQPIYKRGSMPGNVSNI